MGCAQCGLEITTGSMVPALGRYCSPCAASQARWVKLRPLSIGLLAVGSLILLFQFDGTPPRGRTTVPLPSSSAVPAGQQAPSLTTTLATPRSDISAGAQHSASEDLASTGLAVTVERLRSARQGPPAPESTPVQETTAPSPPPVSPAVEQPAPTILPSAPLTEQAQAPTPLISKAGSAWPHRTSSGVQWRLMDQGGRSLLSIDLGEGRVADVQVAPEFRSLDFNSASGQVEYVRRTIAQSYMDQPGDYMFLRDGRLLRE